MASLQEAVTRELEAMVATGKYELQSDFAKKYFAKGQAEGKAEGKAEGRAEGEVKGRLEAQADLLIKVLEHRGFEMSTARLQRVAKCTDGSQLDRWFERALSAERIEDVFIDT